MTISPGVIECAVRKFADSQREQEGLEEGIRGSVRMVHASLNCPGKIMNQNTNGMWKKIPESRFCGTAWRLVVAIEHERSGGQHF